MTTAYNRDGITYKVVVPSVNWRPLRKAALLAAAIASIGAGTALGLAGFEYRGSTSNEPVGLVSAAAPLAKSGPDTPAVVNPADSAQGLATTINVPMTLRSVSLGGGQEIRPCRGRGRSPQPCWAGPPEQGEPPAQGDPSVPPPTTDPTTPPPPPPPPPDTGKPDEIRLPARAGDLRLPPRPAPPVFG